MKIAILNDTHFGVRKSLDVFLDHQERFYSDIFFPYLKKYDINTIFHLGDLLDDRKALNPKALYRMRKMFLEPIRDNNIQMFVIPGNHDVFYKNSNRISGLKEALGFFTDNVKIFESCEIIKYNNKAFGFVPWINGENSQDVFSFLKKNKKNIDVLFGHFEFIGFEMEPGIMCVEGVDGYEEEYFGGYKKIISGHFHHKSQKKNIYYLGTQYQMTWSDYDDQKYFHVFDTESLRLTPVKNPYTLFTKIKIDDHFDYNIGNPKDIKGKFVRVMVYSKKDLYQFDQFIDKLKRLDPYSLDIQDFSISIDLEKELENNKEAQKFISDNDASDSLVYSKQYIDSYIDFAKSHLNKEKLKSMFSEIYAEALKEE